MSQEISAGIIIYRNTSEGKKFLLLYHGGRYWNFPKGKLDVGEKSFRAALREVREETGLSERDLKFKEFFKAYDRFVFMRQKQKVFKTVMYYLAETNEEEIKISKEHNGYGWFLYRDALRMLLYPNLKNNLKRAYTVISRGGLPRTFGRL